MRTLHVQGDVTLQQCMQIAGWVSTGGQAKAVIVEGEVRVNDGVETRRNKRLHAGDVVSYAGQQLTITGS